MTSTIAEIDIYTEEMIQKFKNVLIIIIYLNIANQRIRI